MSLKLEKKIGTILIQLMVKNNAGTSTSWETMKKTTKHLKWVHGNLVLKVSLTD